MDNWRMAKKQIPPTVGRAAIENRELPTATRYLLQEIEKRHPGGSVELRVPPFGAIQCIEGMDHRRGTPPNVVELSAEVFLDLCLGESSWEVAVASGVISASGAKASEVATVFPLSLSVS